MKMRNNYSYRKIWERNFGPIPIDDLGRSYHIHHIDGNRNNNDVTNLLCLSAEEHYLLHLEQGDVWEASRLLKFLNIDKNKHTELISQWNVARIENGIHNFLLKNKQHEQWFLSLQMKMRERVINNQHHFQSHYIRDKVKISIRKRLIEGTHNFLQEGHIQRQSQLALNRIENGTHNFQNLEFRQKMKEVTSRATKNTQWYKHRISGKLARMKVDDKRLQIEVNNWIKGR